ncbi:hypothetical protein OG467_06720 [Streptomyces sp. NBC_01361]|nr:hypothetical protein [Streptomyces sp. NBC_01361]
MEDVVDGGERIVVRARTPQDTDLCPVRGASSGRVHGHYWRTVADVPVDTVLQQLETTAADAVRAYAANTRESADHPAAVLENIAGERPARRRGRSRSGRRLT